MIPSCVVKVVREKFPEENGQYVGFRNQESIGLPN